MGVGHAPCTCPPAMSPAGQEPATLGETYRRESRQLCRQAAATACLLGFPLVPAFALLDWVVFPERFVIFLQMRLACVASLAVIWAFLQGPGGERYALGLGLLVSVD